ncbi:MAG TPA: hypothetical protein VJW23_13775 [Propionibacteriaceae bacterium]|nr:hypothetical protein [Propionibacteriaceae bacterium]
MPELRLVSDILQMIGNALFVVVLILLLPAIIKTGRELKRGKR